MVNYEVLSQRYVGNSHSPTAIRIAAESIKSMQFIPLTEASHPYNLSLPSKPHFFKDADGKTWAMKRTSNNIFVTDDYSRNGDFSPQIDDGIRRGSYQFSTFDSWKATGENSQTRDPVKLRSKGVNTGYIENFRERPLKLTSKDTSVNLHVRDSYYTGPNNELGKYVSIAAKMKHDLMKYYGLKDSQEFAAFLNSKGLDMEDIGWLAVGFIPEGALYAVNRGKDGKVIFFTGEESFDSVSGWAKHTGLTVDELKAYGIGEEVCHIARKSFDKSIRTLAGIIREEMETKEMQMDFYVQQAKGAQGNHKLARHYMKLAAMRENDIQETRKVYTKMLRQYRRDLENTSEEHEEHGESEQKSHQASSIDGRVARILEGNSEAKKESTEPKNNVVYGVFGKSGYSSEKAESSSSKSEYNEQNASKKSYSAKAAGSKSNKSETKESAEGKPAEEAKPNSEAHAEDGRQAAEFAEASEGATDSAAAEAA